MLPPQWWVSIYLNHYKLKFKRSVVAQMASCRTGDREIGGLNPGLDPMRPFISKRKTRQVNSKGKKSY